MKNCLYQTFHLVTFRPWPILLSISSIIIFIRIIIFLKLKILLYTRFILTFLILYQWWRDVIREGLYQGYHTKNVIIGIKIGIILFIVSEIFFFFGIFWTYFHIFLAPRIDIGINWPPKNITIFNPYHIPLLNTLILLISGIYLTWCHYRILLNNYYKSLISIILTIILGIIFIYFQFIEYSSAKFCINDSVFGSIFYIRTGFHGFHVFIGLLFLTINFLRIFYKNFSKSHHLRFEFAAWYWHFVDIVWLFLYLNIYYWIY